MHMDIGDLVFVLKMKIMLLSVKIFEKIYLHVANYLLEFGLFWTSLKY
jgi:hypothetical protein